MTRWAVQARWTVDGEERSYAPALARTRRGAERLKSEMEQTVAHFPTLTVTIARATDEDRGHEAAMMAKAKAVTPHLKFRPDDAVTACGLPEESVTAWSLPDIYALTPEDKRCPGCAQALASGA